MKRLSSAASTACWLILLSACEAPAPSAPDASQAPEATKPAPRGFQLPDFQRVYKRAAPSVVNVRATQAQGGRTRSLGSGFALDAQGHLLTCGSVVESAQGIEVELLGGRVLAARVEGRDPVSDLALLKVDPAQAPPPLPTAPPGALRPGDWVAAFGYPYGLSHSISAGMVSAIRSAEQMPGSFGRILCDAAINPGSNGGPLLDTDGRLVGINLVPPAAEGELGLALPWQDVAERVQALLDGQAPKGSWLGLAVQALSVQRARELGLPNSEGALVRRIQPGSPGAQAGLKAGDLILRLGKQRVEDPQALREQLECTAAGEPLKIQVWRDGQSLELDCVPLQAQ